MFTVKQHHDEAVTYVPDFLKNRELAEKWVTGGEQGPRSFFTVTLLPLSGNDFNKLSNQSYRKLKKNMDFMEGAERTVARVVKQYVPEVDGLAFERRDGSTAQPTNGGELYHECSIGYQALGDMIDDIVEALKDVSKADEGDLKKLRLQFGGPRQPRTNTRQDVTGGVLAATRTSSNDPMNPANPKTEKPATAMVAEMGEV